MPDQRVTVNSDVVFKGEVNQLISLFKCIGIFCGMEITHLHDIAGGDLAEVVLDQRSVYIAIVAENAVGFATR